MTPIRMAFPLMRKSKASSPRCSTSQRATIAPWKPISTRSVVSNGPGRINQAFSVRSSTWPKSQLRADWADFKWRHFQGDVILWAVRWYCRYPISYRDLEEMLAERGISVNHTTIYRWVQFYAPEMEKRLRWRSEEHTSELQALMRTSYAVFCLKKKPYKNRKSLNNALASIR